MLDLSDFEVAEESLDGRDYPAKLRKKLSDEQWDSLAEACRSGRYQPGAVRKVLMSWTGEEPHSTTIKRLMTRFQSGELV